MSEKTQGTFDFKAWKSQGEKALEELILKEETLEAELETIKGQIAGLKHSLGHKDSEKKRPRIRPLILKELERNIGAKLPLGVVYQALVKINPDIKRESFEKSASRLVAANNKISLLGTNEIILQE